MSYAIISQGESRSFPNGDPFHAAAVEVQGAEVVVYLGNAVLRPHPDKRAVLVELRTECLAVHIPDDNQAQFQNVVGFARYRNGSDPPSNLVELVRRTETADGALSAARP